jgi:hypothetical protein
MLYGFFRVKLFILIIINRALMWVSKNEFEIAKNKLTDILKNNPDNMIIMNNLSIMNLYLNRVDRCYTDLKLIVDPDQMNFHNDITLTNINLISDIFNIKKR